MSTTDSDAWPATGAIVTTTVNIPATFTYDETAKILTCTVCGAASGTVDPDTTENQAILDTAIKNTNMSYPKGKVLKGSYNFKSATELNYCGIVFTKE